MGKKKQLAAERRQQKAATKWRRRVDSVQERREQEQTEADVDEEADDGGGHLLQLAPGAAAADDAVSGSRSGNVAPSAASSGAAVADGSGDGGPTNAGASGKRGRKKGKAGKGGQSGPNAGSVSMSQQPEGETSGRLDGPSERVRTVDGCRAVSSEATAKPDRLHSSTAGSDASAEASVRAQAREMLIRNASDALEGAAKRKADDLLSLFLRKDGHLPSILSCDCFDSQPTSFYEALLSALAAPLVTCFLSRSMESMRLLSLFIDSSTFRDGLCRMKVLMTLDAASLQNIVTILSIASQEMPDQSDSLLFTVRGLENVVRLKHARNPRLMKETSRLCRQLQCDQAFQTNLGEILRQRSAFSGAGIYGPGNYRAMNILPTDAELKLGKQPDLPVNRLEGNYASSTEYVETHFRLLREDFVGPLRSAVKEFVARSSRGERFWRLDDARLYLDVTVLPDFEGTTFSFKLDLRGSALDKWEDSKHLQYGSLVLLSLDQFWTITYASVEGKGRTDRGAALLKLSVISGHAQVLDGLRSCMPGSGKFAMIESTSYYEGYRYNASILQQMDLNTLPFREYLVDCCATPFPPDYLWLKAGTETSKARYDFTAVLKTAETNHQFRSVAVTETSEWPRATSLGLDDSQAEALKMALTQKLAIIQGPPGTGKTFVGTKVVDMLLANDRVWRSYGGRPRGGSPASSGSSSRGGNASPFEGQNVMVICYTNHALDQFLEHIIRRHPDKVIRVGGQSGNAVLAQYNLKEIMKRQKLQRHSDYYSVRNRIKSLEKNLVEKCKSLNREISWNEASKLLDRRQAEQFEGAGQWKKWVTCSDLVKARRAKKTANIEELEDSNRASPAFTSVDNSHLDLADPETQYDPEAVEPLADGSDAWRLIALPNDTSLTDPSEVDEADEADRSSSLQSNVEQSAGSGCLQSASSSLVPGPESLAKSLARDLGAARLSPLRMTPEEAEEVQDMWNLDVTDRCRMHKYLASIVHDDRERELDELNARIAALTDTLHEMRMREMLPAFKDRPIVGMTITGAAKYSILMRLLRPKIVIIEEAAEVLEAHILTSITDRCQHLILIGDHQQLRPNPAVYDLACNYNLDVSLFERMVKHHSLPFTCLKIQHRMRPEISKVMTPIFYKELLDHPCVDGRPDVRGIMRNIFFLSHTERELGDDSDTRSHVNEHEALLVQCLCGYLLKQIYQPKQITVLVAYTGQLFACRRLLQQQQHSASIRVTTVDNYQGEENDIIILSLVRSSEKGSIGFLKTDNRICVALSRARLGFYCLGNFDLLSRKSDTWSSIAALLCVTEEIGYRLPLGCHKHADQRYYASKPEDFLAIPDNGCRVACDERLPCGHTCSDLCHPDDPSHAGARQCRKACSKLCPKGHRSCTRLCRQACEPCMHGVPRRFEDCGHTWQVPCCFADADSYCSQPVPFVLPCSHRVQYPCHQSACANSSCNKVGWVVAANSGKPQEGFCSEVRKMPCLEPSWKTYEGCSHRVQVSCHALNCPNSSAENCQTIVSVLDTGSSRISVYCRDFGRLPCPVSVDRELPCGHSTKAVCSDPLELVPCPIVCKEKRPLCGHEVEKVCSSRFDGLPPCTASIDVQLPCSHVKTVVCGSPDMTCVDTIELPLPCGHLKKTSCRSPDKRCRQPVEKRLPCGHVSTVECAELTPKCTQLVEVPRPGCKHTIRKQCGDSIHNVVDSCSVLMDKQLACGHTAQVKCHAIDSSVKCTAQSEVELPCGHTIEKICHLAISAIKCLQPVEVELECHHSQTLLCHKRSETKPCAVLTTMTLPRCGHEITKLCAADPSAVMCVAMVTKNLPCTHSVITICGIDPTSIRCGVLVDKRLPCGHNVQGSCCEDSGTRSCDQLVDERLPCGHDATFRCGHRPSQCSVQVTKRLPCGHQVVLPCSRDVSTYLCLELVSRALTCGHLTKTSCHLGCCTTRNCSVRVRIEFEGNEEELEGTCDALRAAQCPVIVSRELPCHHKAQLRCGDAEDHVCSQRVEKELSCRHKATSYCHVVRCTRSGCTKPVGTGGRCDRAKLLLETCLTRVKYPLPCKHVIDVPCHVAGCSNAQCSRGGVADRGKSQPCQALKRSVSAACRVPVGVALPCGHSKTVPCSSSRSQCTCTAVHLPSGGTQQLKQHSLCELHTCSEPVQKRLDCGHSYTVPCSERSQPLVCTEHVDLVVPTCCHAITVACSSLGTAASQGHGHGQQQLLRHSVACKEESCSRWCSHGGCTGGCSEPCVPCTSPCSAGCQHKGKCQRLCFQACDVPPCDQPCCKVLRCGHPCLGLCGEQCPDVCCDCQRSMLFRRVCARYKFTAGAFLLSLKPCGHVIPVDYMDDVVKKYAESVAMDGGHSFRVRPLTCPECRQPVGGCQRYDRLLKRYYNYKRKLPADVTGEWLGCAKGHVRPADETRCGDCDERGRRQLQLLSGQEVVVTAGKRRGAVGEICDIVDDEVIIRTDSKMIVVDSSILRSLETGPVAQHSGTRGPPQASNSVRYASGQSMTFSKSTGGSGNVKH